jgi:GT2 family glycosyltransferase
MVSADTTVGVVAIGRNEGARLQRCLESVREQCGAIVYVDSGSEDDSVEAARALSVDVVELDLAIPFTAARARNEGLRRLRERHPGIALVQFIDGDCELVRGWIEAARRTILASPDVAVVCGRRRERFRDATVFNRLCDLEWDTPVGPAEACGGDALMRIAALEQVGGFDASLIAGEEPDLCLRLRRAGFSIMRIAEDMTLHDAAMTRASQWWRRTIRSGFASAQAVARYGSGAREGDRRCVRSAVVWTVVLPALALAAILFAWTRVSVETAWLVAGFVVAGLCAQIARIALRRPTRGAGPGDAWLYACSCMAGKLPEAVGMLRYLVVRARGLSPRLIEYK